MSNQPVHLFVFDTMSDWEPSYAIAGLNSPAFPGANVYPVKTVGLGRDPIRTMGGVTILPDMTLAELDPAQSAMLILPGGTLWDTEQANQLAISAEIATQFLDAGVPVAAICGATAGLARAGLLDERRHTSNASIYLQATHYRGAEQYVEAPVVEDRLLITAGATGAVDFAAQIFRKLGVYSAEIIDSWHALFKTGEARYFAELIAAAQ